MAEWRLDQFNAQGLVNTAWAFAIGGQQDDQLVKALARMAEWRLDEFNTQDLANTAWALMDSAALHARELGKRSSRGVIQGGWVESGIGKEG